MYDHTKQYRCTIIRGKSKKEMDDLLPAYAMVIDEICPCRTEEFDTLFNNAFQRFLPESDRIKKTLDNHRTEISGKLSPLSHFEIALSVRNNFSARSFCVIFFSFRSCATNFPIFSLSMGMSFLQGKPPSCNRLHKTHAYGL